MTTPAKAAKNPNVDDIEELSAYQSDDDEPDTVTGVDKPADKPKYVPQIPLEYTNEHYYL